MPKKAHRILPAFRDILDNASKNVLESPSSLWSTRVFILHSCMEEHQFSRVLKFLGVGFVPYQWYSRCILSSFGWVVDLSEDLYVQLLCFLSEHWESGISTSLQNFPLFKLVNHHHKVDWASYQIYLMAINNIFPLRWNTFHGWKDGVGSLDMLRISNSCQMPLKWP